MKNLSFTFPVLPDPNSEIAGKYHVNGLPTTFFIGKDGKIIEIKLGAFSSTEEIESSLTRIFY